MRRSRDCVNFLCVSLVVVTLHIQVMSGNQAGRHTYVVRYKHGDSLIPVTVVLDYKRQTEYVINMNSRTPAKSVTLYDFKERVIAYKDLKNGECFIGRLTHETIHNEDAVLKRLKSPVEDHPLILTINNNRPSLTPTEVRNMAGHKTAVFCRRMNTWTLLPESENKRERRDTLSHLDSTSAGYEEHAKVKTQRNKLFESDSVSRQRNKTVFRDFPSHRRSDYLEATSSLHPSIVDPSRQDQSPPNVYPFILPRQRSIPEKTEDRRSSRENFSIHNVSKKTADDSSPQFGFVNGRSSMPRFSEFPHHLDNGTTVLSSTKHTFIPLNTNRPFIIPSIGIPGKFPESKIHYGSKQVSSPDPFTGGFPQNAKNFHTLHNRRGESVGNYPPPFQQLPPEAFILPLTRSATATTAPFVFNNRLGYELVHPDTPGISNNTVAQSGPVISSAESEHGDKSVVLTRRDHSSLEVGSQPTSGLDNHDVFANLPNISDSSDNPGTVKKDDISLPREKSLDHQETEGKASFISSRMNEIRFTSPERPFNETIKSSADANTTSTNRVNVPTVERGDLPIDVPRWYPEITKQISIPLELEVLHHREEYAPNISNRTEEVLSVRGHETEDHTFLPSVNTALAIPVETYSNGLRFDKKVKLLPQVSSIPDEDLSNDTLKQTSDKTEKSKKFEPRGESGYFIYGSEVSNITHQQVSPTPYTPFRNNTETLISSADSEHGSAKKQNRGNQILPPTSSHEEAVIEGRLTPKRPQHVTKGSVAVHDVKIDEGVPSYRKRYPAVTQLFTPEETVGDIGRLPDRQFRSGHQNPFRRKRPSAFGNKTHGVPPHRQESATPWRKHNQDVSRSFLNRQQTKLSDQGITFHHRGLPKTGVPGSPYDHHMKRFGVLPPGVSVHPRHPQAPYADLALGTVDKTVPVNPLLQPRPRRAHLRHHRRHQRKRNRALPPLNSGLPASNCCGNDGFNCCSGRRRRGHHSSKGGAQRGETRRPNSVLPSQNDQGEVTSKKQVKDDEDRCMKEKMCRTVYQSTKKVFVCRNIEVDGC